MFKNPNNWLLYQTKQHVKKRSQILHEHIVRKLISGIQNFVNSFVFTWIIIAVIAIVLIFIIPMKNISSLKFIYIFDESLKTIIDNRLANITTLASVTFAVIGFLLSNMALKEGTAYKALFKYSWFHPIIYFILSVIGCLVILSLYKDNFKLKNETYYINMVFMSSYLFILILILIGFLFKRILIFTDEEQIRAIIKKEIIDEVKLNIKRSLYVQISRNEMNALFRSYNIVPPILAPTIKKSKTKRKPDVTYYVYDINTKKLDNILSRHDLTNVINYSLTHIGQIIKYDQELFSISNTYPNYEKIANQLNSCVTISTKSSIHSERTTALKYLDEKFAEAVKDDKIKMVAIYLSWYEEILILKEKINNEFVQ